LKVATVGLQYVCRESWSFKELSSLTTTYYTAGNRHAY
jgi:hypothetical protein